MTLEIKCVCVRERLTKRKGEPALFIIFTSTFPTITVITIIILTNAAAYLLCFSTSFIITVS